MVRNRCIADVILPCVAVILCLADPRSGVAEQPFRLSKEHDSVFRQDIGSGTSYLYFCKNGRYRLLDREHMFTCESDRGTWTQGDSGQIELISDILLKEFVRPPFRIRVRDFERFAALDPLEADITDYLSKNRQDSYGREEIEQAWQYEYTWSLFNSHRAFSAIAVNEDVDTVTRRQMEELLKAWKEYLGNDAKNRFHIVPVQHREFVLLASKDYSPISDESPEEAKRVADMFAQHDGPPTMVFALRDSEIALKELKRNQPFRYFPELNQDHGREILQYESLKPQSCENAEQ